MNRMWLGWIASSLWVLLTMVSLPAVAKDGDILFDYPMSAEDKLAQQLNNPLANLISVPIQNNFDYGGGRNDDGFRFTMSKPQMAAMLQWCLGRSDYCGQVTQPRERAQRIGTLPVARW